MYKMVVFDIDGTLVPHSDHEFHDEIKDMFKRLKDNGFTTVLASGRDFVSIGNIINYDNIDYFIGANGSFVFDMKEKKFLFNSPIDFDIFNQYYKDILEKEKDTFNIMLSDDSNVFVNEIEKISKHWFWSPFVDKFIDIDEAHKKINKEYFHLITISQKNDSIINKTKEYFKKYDLPIDIQSSWDSGFFIANKGIKKSSGINFLCNLLNMSFDNVIAFGDGRNDIDMLSKVGLSVAMGNAVNEVKKIAKDITKDVDEFGTKDFLEKKGFI